MMTAQTLEFNSTSVSLITVMIWTYCMTYRVLKRKAKLNLSGANGKVLIKHEITLGKNRFWRKLVENRRTKHFLKQMGLSIRFKDTFSRAVFIYLKIENQLLKENIKLRRIIALAEKSSDLNRVPNGTNIGEPVSAAGDVVAGKTRVFRQVNNSLRQKINEPKQQYAVMLEDFEWNNLVYDAKRYLGFVIGGSHQSHNTISVNHFSACGVPLAENKYISRLQIKQQQITDLVKLNIKK